MYHNVSFGYNIEPLNTRRAGRRRQRGDKQPPILYLNNVLNANTDPATYDTAGRFYWASLTVKF